LGIPPEAVRTLVGPCGIPRLDLFRIEQFARIVLSVVAAYLDKNNLHHGFESVPLVQLAVLREQKSRRFSSPLGISQHALE